MVINLLCMASEIVNMCQKFWVFIIWLHKGLQKYTWSAILLIAVNIGSN
jgi:hypothetical protein